MQMNLVSNLMQRSLNGWLLYLRSDARYRLSWTFVSFICGSAIDRVSSFVHLGHIINTELSDNDDIAHRRCTFVGQVNNVLCTFPMLGTNVR